MPKTDKKTKVVKKEAVAKKAKVAVAKTATVKAVKKEKAPMSDDFAVISSGGKQYKVSPNESIKIEKMLGDHKVGDKITFDKVLFVDDGQNNVTIGTPYIKGAKVEAELTEIGRSQKVMVIRYKSKSRYFKKNGHRQPYFKVKITSIK